MTSDSNWLPNRFTKIDELTRCDHWYLTEEDECFFLGEYTARAGFSHSPTNDLIQNLKKPMDRRGRPEWRYKSWAIRTAATALKGALLGDTSQLMMVPIPPSKAQDDPMYDDRLKQILDLVAVERELDVREIITQIESAAAAHETDDPRRPEEILRLYQITPGLIQNPKELIGVFDDILTTGAHFKAMQQVLTQQFPTARIVGIFLARRVPQAADLDFDDWEDF